jgi:hypothetical protein
MITKDERERVYIGLGRLVVDFSQEMREKLHRKFEEGKRIGNGSSDELRTQLANCILKYSDGKDTAQLVDIANLAALLWRIEVQNKIPL